MADHRCGSGRCDTTIPLHLVMCRACWSLVPRPLQDLISRARRSTDPSSRESRPYREAMAAAREAVAQVLDGKADAPAAVEDKGHRSDLTGDEIFRWRRRLGVTQTELAVASRRSRSTVERVEHGQSGVGTPSWRAVVDGLERIAAQRETAAQPYA